MPWSHFERGNTFVIVTQKDVTIDLNREALLQWLADEAQLFSASDSRL